MSLKTLKQPSQRVIPSLRTSQRTTRTKNQRLLRYETANWQLIIRLGNISLTLHDGIMFRYTYTKLLIVFYLLSPRILRTKSRSLLYSTFFFFSFILHFLSHQTEHNVRENMKNLQAWKRAKQMVLLTMKNKQKFDIHADSELKKRKRKKKVKRIKTSLQFSFGNRRKTNGIESHPLSYIYKYKSNALDWNK